MTRPVLELQRAYDTLEPPRSADTEVGRRFTAVPVDGFPQHRIGKDEQSNPSLMITAHSTSTETWPAPIALEHLSVQHDVECRIIRPEGLTETGRFTLVRCTAGDRDLDAYFLHIAGALIPMLGDVPSAVDVSRAIDRLVRLFRAMSSAPRKTVQGLWAELLLIVGSREPRRLIRAWHASAGDRYDFSEGPERVEVKSTSGRARHHHFALDQLIPIPGTRVLIASLLVERAGAGSSLRELIEEAREHLTDDPELAVRVDEVVIQTLGTGWRTALEDRFDRHLAESSRQFYEPDVIPRVSEIVPAGVSDVHFRVDLTRTVAADLRPYRQTEGILRAVVGR